VDVLVWTDTAAADYARLKVKALAALERKSGTQRAKASRDEGLFKQVHTYVSLLAENPRHPGLQTHEFRSLQHPFNAREKVFEAYAQNNTPAAYRVFWCYAPATGPITVIALTPHP